jgi:hypothetical protein
MEAKRRALEAVGATFKPANEPAAERNFDVGTPRGTVQ